MNDRMQELKLSDLKEKLENRKSGERLVFREVQLEKGDLSGTDLSNTDFTLCSFDGVMLNNVDFRYSSVENALFDGCSMHGANFENANMRTASFRFCDMSDCNIKGSKPLWGCVGKCRSYKYTVGRSDTVVPSALPGDGSIFRI